MNNKIQLIQIQLAVIDVQMDEGPLEEFQAINKMLGKIVTVTPTVLPFINDQNIPMEIPVVHSRDTETGFGINISRSRVDFFLSPKNEKSIEQFVSLSNQILNKYSIGYGRIGIVGQYVLDNSDPGKWIRNTFIKECISGIDEILLRFNKKENYHGMQINKIVQFQEAVVSLNGIPEKRVHIQVDINTPANHGKRITSDVAVKLLSSKSEMLSAKTVGEILK